MSCQRPSEGAGFARSDYVPASEAGAWGTAAAPLVPRAYRRKYHETRVDPALRAAVRLPDLCLGELDRLIWDRLPWQGLQGDLFGRLRRQVATLAVPDCTYSLPAGVSTDWLLALPLRTRTRNVVAQFCNRNMVNGHLPGTWSAAHLLNVPSAGRLTLVDFLCVVESAERSNADAALPGRDLSRVALPRDEQDGMLRKEVWNQDLKPLRTLLSAAREFRGAKTLKDAFESNLGELAAATGILERLDGVELDVLTGGRRLSGEFVAALESLRASLAPRQVLILRRRLFRLKPAKLREIGELLGVTREGARQIEQKLIRKIEAELGDHIRVLAGAAVPKVDPLLRREDLDRQVARVFADASHPDFGLAGRMLRDALDYKYDGSICLNREAVGVCELLRTAAREQADDAGLVDESALRELLPNADWQRLWPLLVEACGFHRVDGLLGLRNTKKARVKAAVLNIGRPATREEIGERSGMSVARASSYLAALHGVVRADMTRWGLSEWIEDEYDGVAGEILQRIDEDGGATSLERLFDELPNRFGLKVPTIRAYLGTPQFLVRDGYASRADVAAIRLRRIDDAVDGRDQRGRPYWQFEVEERYFAGFSLAGLPPEIAKALGCEPNGRAEASVVHPPECNRLSVRWPLTSLSGATIGHLAEPLRRLGAGCGERVRLTICGAGEVELHRARDVDPGGPVAVEENPAAALLERLKKRREVL